MRPFYTLLLVGVTAVWGWTFVVVADAVALYGVVGFLTLRFGLAAISLSPAISLMDRRTLLTGGAIGLVLGAVYLFQTFGLLYTTPTNAGLITGLFVVFAPLFARFVFGEALAPRVVAAIAVSLGGMALLVGQSPAEVRVGDALVLVCAVALGLHIALLSRYARGHDALGLALAQMLSMTALFALIWPLAEPVELPPTAVWPAIVITGLLASSGAYYVQTRVQQRLPAARTAVILSMEPVFAALFGFWLAGDRLNSIQLAGAALVLCALFLAELWPLVGKRKRRSRV